MFATDIIGCLSLLPQMRVEVISREHLLNLRYELFLVKSVLPNRSLATCLRCWLWIYGACDVHIY